MNDKRIRRPEAERTEPIRDWAGVFNPADTRTRSVEQDVAMGYRVIEDFMRRGATAARDVSQQFAMPLDAKASTLMMERLFQSASDLGGVWLEMMQALWFAAPPRASATAERVDPGGFESREAVAATSAVTPTPTPAPAVTATPAPAVTPTPAIAPPQQPSAAVEAPAQAVQSRPRPTVAFRVRGAKEVELSASVEPDLGPGPFVVHDLRALDPALPSLGPVHFEYEPERARGVAALDIQAHQPAGTYSGLIVHVPTQLPCGSICVRVL